MRGLTDLLHEELGGSLHGLQGDIAREPVAHDARRSCRAGCRALDVAAEVEVVAGGEQRVHLLRQRVSLAGLLPDREQADRGVGTFRIAVAKAEPM